jgi:hypothetical protein
MPGPAAEVVAAEAQRALAGPSGDEDVAQADPGVVRDSEAAAIVAAEHERVRQVVGPPHRALGDREAEVVGDDDQRLARRHVPDQRAQHRLGPPEAIDEVERPRLRTQVGVEVAVALLLVLCQRDRRAVVRVGPFAATHRPAG